MTDIFELDFSKTAISQSENDESDSMVTCTFSRMFETKGLADITPGEVLTYRLGYNIYTSVISNR